MKARRQRISGIMEYRMTAGKWACGSTGRRFQLQRRRGSIRRLRAQMAEIREQQQRMRKGPMEIRDWFEEINFECDQLKKETFLISKQAARNQRRLKLMFKIDENNFSEVDKLPQSKKCRPEKRRSGSVQTNIKLLRAEMAEIVEQQKRISEGQMEMRESVQEIECENDQLRKKTLLISKQVARCQHSLDEMAKIMIGENSNLSLDEMAKIMIGENSNLSLDEMAKIVIGENSNLPEADGVIQCLRL